MTEPKCPECACEHTYQDGHFWICPDCSYEFTPKKSAAPAVAATTSIKDAFGFVKKA